MIAGEGPTLLTEYNPFGARHFLREGDPEGVSELRRRRIPLVDGDPVPKGLAADTDELSPEDLLVYRSWSCDGLRRRSRPALAVLARVGRRRLRAVAAARRPRASGAERLALGDGVRRRGCAPVRRGAGPGARRPAGR